MKEAPIKICTIRKKTPQQAIHNVRNAFLENRNNLPSDINNSDLSVLENFSLNNEIRHPDDERRLLELALPIASLWNPGREIKIAFLSGKRIIRDRVKEYASEWLKYANLNFVYVTKPEQAEIRITFNKKYGSWSGVGTDNLDVDSSESTMNFGWLDDETTEEDFRSVVLHEFGHMIGCGHEHESPKNGGVPWDKEKAYKYYMRTQGWTREEIDQQIFDTYKNNQIRGTKLDKRSIMMYAIPESITIGNFRVGWNSKLSKSDKDFIKKTYPFS